MNLSIYRKPAGSLRGRFPEVSVQSVIDGPHGTLFVKCILLLYFSRIAVRKFSRFTLFFKFMIMTMTFLSQVLTGWIPKPVLTIGVNVSLQTVKGKTYTRTFKNYVDLDVTQFWPPGTFLHHNYGNFTYHLPFVPWPHVDFLLSSVHLPTSSCPRSYWMSPNDLKLWLFENQVYTMHYAVLKVI